MRLTRLAIAGLLVGCAPAATTSAAPDGPKLAFPLACEIGRTCEVQHYVDRDPGQAVKDYRCGRRTYDGHTGVDIRLPDMAAQARGVDVLAAAAGRVVRLRDGVADVSIRSPGAPPVSGQECGNGVVVDHGGGWETQYCHLARGSVRVKVGENVTAGAPLARVGLSGNTEFPHLHLTVRKDGQIVDPFAPDAGEATSCAPRSSLWTPDAARRMAYKAGMVLNAGFAGSPPTMSDIEAGAVARAAPAGDYLIPYVRAIGLERGDVIELTLRGPDGAVLASGAQPPLDNDKAHYFAYVGKRRPASGRWPAGTYSAEYQVRRSGNVVLQHRFEVRL
jgi:hypothetical protein